MMCPKLGKLISFFLTFPDNLQTIISSLYWANSILVRHVFSPTFTYFRNKILSHITIFFLFICLLTVELHYYPLIHTVGFA